MFPKDKRIPRKLFKSLLESKKYFNSQYLSLRIAPSPDRVHLAVSVSKKISKKAVVRNKIRRRIYSAMIELLPDIRPSLYLIIAKSGTNDLKGRALRGELRKLLKI